jgi:hypothetical protein
MSVHTDVPRAKRIRIELPDAGVTASLRLYSERAPVLTELIHRALQTPLETTTSHACFDGHEVFCFLPSFAGRPPLENRTMRPEIGEVMFFYADEHEFACLSDLRLTAGEFPMCELAFMYGRVDLRYHSEEGLLGSLVGRVDVGLDAFAQACEATLSSGSTRLRLTAESPSGTGLGGSALRPAATSDDRP